jgi:hypothetical protein
MKTVTPNLQLAQRILRMATAGNTFRRGQDAVGPTLADWGGHATMPGGTHVSDAGQFGAGATLPSQSSPPDPVFSDPGPIEPAALAGAGGDNGPNVEVGVGDPLTTRLGTGFSPIPGENWLGSLGGAFDHRDENTGQPVYNPLGTGSLADLGIRYGGVERTNGGNASGGGKVASGNPFSVASKRAGHSANYWVF